MMTIDEFCKSFGININDQMKSEVVQFVSILDEEVKKGTRTLELRKFITSLYAVLRKHGMLTAELKNKLKPYIDFGLLRIINKYCDKCIDLKTSIKTNVANLFDLNENERKVFEEFYEKIVEKISEKKKTLSIRDYHFAAYVAINVVRKVTKKEFAEMMGITTVTLRIPARSLFGTNLSTFVFQFYKEKILSELLNKCYMILNEEEKTRFNEFYEKIVEEMTAIKGKPVTENDHRLAIYLALYLVKKISFDEFRNLTGMYREQLSYTAKSVFKIDLAILREQISRILGNL